MKPKERRPLFLMEHLHRVPRRLKLDAGRGEVKLTRFRIETLIREWVEAQRPDAPGGAVNTDERLTEDEWNVAEELLEERPREIANAHIAFFLYILLENIESAVLLQFSYEAVHGKTQGAKPQIAPIAWEYYLDAVRRALGVKPGRRRDDDPWRLLERYEILHEVLRQEGARNPAEKACDQLASEDRVEPEAMQQRLKRARRRVRRFAQAQREQK